MKKCTKCDISYADDKNFCKKCGSSLSQEYNIDPKELAKKAVYEEKLKADSLNTDLLLEYSLFLYKNLLFKEAVSNLLKILAIIDNQKQANELLFKCYLKLGKYSDARDIGKQLLENNKTDTFLLEELANIETQLDNKAKAIDYYETILKFQPKNTKALYSKATIFIENNELEKAINIFKELYKDGDRDRITIIYAGVDKCLSGNYEDATKIFTPCLSENDISLSDLHNLRGFLYLAYSLCKTKKPLNKIDEWFSLLDFELLNNLKQPLDEEILAKTILEVINIYFTIDKHDINPSNINYVIDKYISKPEFCFTSHTKNMHAEIWVDISELQKGAELFSEAQDSLKKATELSPDNTEHENKLNEATALYNKQKKCKKRKTVIITGFVFTIAVLIILSVNLYNQHKENKAWEVAKQENTYESYGVYLRTYPNNRFSKEAEHVKEKVLWEKAMEMNTVEFYDDYLGKYPNGKYISEAKIKKEDSFWKDVQEKNTLQAYNNYIDLYNNGKYLNDAVKKRNKAVENLINIEKIKNDLLGKLIPNWKFDYLSEIKNIDIKKYDIDKNEMSIYANMKLEDYKTKGIFYASTILKYKSFDSNSWNFENVLGYHYSSNANNYFISGKLFIIGKWRWTENVAEYKSDGTWSGKWDDGSERNGFWAIVEDKLNIYTGNSYNLWLSGKIINYNHQKFEVNIDGNKNIAERIK